jgi:predicted permease
MSDTSGRRRSARLFPRRPDVEVDDELAFHLEERIRALVAQGMDPGRARAVALERFGDMSAVRRECAQMLAEDRRAERRRDWLDDLRQDLRFALRSAIRAPLFSLLAILTLALGIGANAAVFGVVKSVLLDALPYRDADRLVRVYGRVLDGTNDRGPLSPGSVTDIAARQRSFERMASFAGLSLDGVYAGTDNPRLVKVAWVEPTLFTTLGVSAARGRTLVEEDAQSDTAFNVVLTHAAWQRLFAGDPGVMQRPVRVNGIARTVVGILPREFVGPVAEADFYFPLGLASALTDPIGARRSHWLGMVGRLKSGVTVEAARSELVAIAADLAREYPKDNGSISVTVLPVREALAGDTRTPLLVLMASAALVLLITCANLAGALLSRTISRRKEFAVRVAMGAKRGRLVRQLLTESTVLAIAGGAAGMLLATLGLNVVRGLASPALPEYADLSLDGGALLVTALLALATGIAFGMAPALAVGRHDVQSTLRDETHGASESRQSCGMRGVLVAGQIALCVSLLAGAGLLARSLWAMVATPLGFHPENVLTLAVELPQAEYRTPEARLRFLEQYGERLAALPGVTAVANVGMLPTRVLNRMGIFIEGAPPLPDDAQPFVLHTAVSDDYFRVLGIALLDGRVFGPRDHANAPQALIVSQALARRYWPNGDAVGSRVRIGPNPQSPLLTVVGVVGDVRNDPTLADPEPMIYTTSRQVPWIGPIFLVKASRDPSSLMGPARRALSEVDPDAPLHTAMTLRDVLSERLAGRRLPVVLMTAFGGLALLLASVGVYAMFASMAAAREREFGVRVALGSSRGAIAGLVIRQGAIWMGVGLAGGALGVYAVSRFLRELLYGVAPFDPVALGIAVATLIVCAAVALLVPVRRATRADPISVLR